VDCSIALKFGIEFHHIIDDTLQMFKVKGQRKVQQLQTWHGVIIKAEEDCHGIGWPQFCNAFAIATFSSSCRQLSCVTEVNQIIKFKADEFVAK